MLGQERLPAKFNDYSILASRTQYFSFSTRAMLPEAALTNLWERLRKNNNPVPPGKSRLITSVWDDPNERGSEWLIAGPTLDANTAETTQYAWNRNAFIGGSFTVEALADLRKYGFLT